MKFNSFEEIVIWQKSKDLTVKIYSLFLNCKDYSFRDQVQRASVSIMNNIAEGFERQSNAEFKHFLYIAKGSSGEVRSLLILAKELKYLKSAESDNLIELCTEISKMLSGLIKTL